MSKRRNSSSQAPRILKYQNCQLQNTQSTEQQSKVLGKTLFQQTRQRTLKTQISINDQKLTTVFNRNISKFRDLINSNDKSLLPFISSLRDCSLKNKQTLQFPIKTRLEPFNVSDKITCNQKIHKDLNDIKGRTKRLSNAFYRWHNSSGSGVKEGCLFQSKLRETKLKFYDNKAFRNIFKQIQKPRIGARIYTQSQIICQKQRRLFTIQN